MAALLMALGLVAYNNLMNLWGRFGQAMYLPCNLALAAGLAGAALGPLRLDAARLGLAGPYGADLVLGALMGAALILPLFVAARIPRLAPLIADRRIADMSDRALAYNVLLRIPVGTAFVEELAFRGALLAAWSHHGVWQAAAASSVCFGLWHVTPAVHMVRTNRPHATARYLVGAAGLTVAVTTVVGVVLTWLRLTSGGLALPIALHATVNSLSTLAAAAALRRSEPRWAR